MVKGLTITLIVVLIVTIWPACVLADQHTVMLPLIFNGDMDSLYAYAPYKPFWRRNAVTQLQGLIRGTAVITGLQTIVIRYYNNSLQRPLRWYLVASDDETWIAGKLLRFGTFNWENETALILVVPTTDRLTQCYANTLIAVADDALGGWTCAKGTFPPPCKESEYWSEHWYNPMLPVLRFWK